MSKSVAKHAAGPYRATPIDNVRWSIVMSAVFLALVFVAGFATLALL